MIHNNAQDIRECQYVVICNVVFVVMQKTHACEYPLPFACNVEFVVMPKRYESDIHHLLTMLNIEDVAMFKTYGSAICHFESDLL